MEVKPGYKSTKVGVVPQDWEVQQLENVADVIMGQSPAGSSYNKLGIGIPLLNGPTEFTKVYPVKVQWTSQPTKTCKNDDLLLCVRGSSTGRINVSDDVYCIGRGIAAIRATQKSNTEYLTYQIILGLTRLLALSAGSTFPNVDGKSIRSIDVPLPPTKAEQEAIAHALSDAGALVESLEQLLAKKRHIKQGAMQELLRPKDGWKKRRLGGLGSFLKGSGVRKNESLSGELPCIRYGEIYTRHNDRIRTFHSWISPEVATTARRIVIGDLLFAGSGETKEEIGKCVAFTDDIDAYAGGDIVILRPEKTNSIFLGYYLNTPAINQQKASKGQGDAVVHISSAALASIDITVPTLEEQEDIATVIFDMDEEISALEAKLEKARQIKQGMMQELLTGRIRLV